MSDSDAEEMAAMRNSSRYAGGRKPAEVEEEAPAPAKTSRFSSGSVGQSLDTADIDEKGAAAAKRAEAAARASRGQQQQRGPQRPNARAPVAMDESDEEFIVEENAANVEMRETMGLPLNLGRAQSSHTRKALGADSKVLEAARRQDPKDKTAEKKAGVTFGPRAMDSAAITGKASRLAAATALVVQEAEANAKAEQAEEDAKLAKLAKNAGLEDDGGDGVYGFGKNEAPPAPGTEHEVIPVSHEAVIPALLSDRRSSSGQTITAIGLDPKGSRMICGSMDGQCKFYDFNGMSEAKESFRSLEPVEGHMVQAISYSTTGNCALIVTSDAHARVFDRDGGSKPMTGTVKGDMYVRDMSHTNGHTQMLTDGMWHPIQCDNFVTSSIDGTLRIWDMKSKLVGMDQLLPALHTLKCVDKRNVCVGGGSGRQGGLYPSCVAYSPTGSMIVAGCSDGSLQVFHDKCRYQRPDKIVRIAHTALITNISFLGDGVGGNKMITRSLDNTMKLWDCRVLSDAKGPVHTWKGLPTTHEKQRICSSPDGKYIVAGTSYDRATNANATVRVYNAEDDFSQIKSLDFGKRSVVGLTWHGEINQILIGTSTGEVVMLYSPFSSKKGALHFVGRHRRSKHDEEFELVGPIWPMVDGPDIAKFYQTAAGPGSMQVVRKMEIRQNQKTITPLRPAELDGKTATTMGTKLVSQVILKYEGKNRTANQDSQKELLKYAPGGEKHAGKTGEKQEYMSTYLKNQPVNILDYTMDEGEGDEKMQMAMNGDFCRKCGAKICRCSDYSLGGPANKKPKIR